MPFVLSVVLVRKFLQFNLILWNHCGNFVRTVHWNILFKVYVFFQFEIRNRKKTQMAKIWCFHINWYKLFIVHLFLTKFLLKNSFETFISEKCKMFKRNHYCYWNKSDRKVCTIHPAACPVTKLTTSVSLAILKKCCIFFEWFRIQDGYSVFWLGETFCQCFFQNYFTWIH